MVIDFKNVPNVKDRFMNKKTVLVGGCFDVFHFGHLQFLNKAKEQGDYLVVILEPDEVIRSKNRIPVHNQEQRAQILDAIEIVDLIIKIPDFKSDEDYSKLTAEIKPKIIAITEGDEQTENKKKQAESVGGELRVVTQFIKDFSSAKITNHASISRP